MRSFRCVGSRWLSPELSAEARAARAGIYHLSNVGQTTWYGFAESIFADMAARGEKPARLVAIPSSAYPTPAKRPRQSCLDNTRLQTTFGIRLPEWSSALQTCLAEQVEKQVEKQTEYPHDILKKQTP
jgi:dTDP-4-dehydrorhamnose reductase